MRTIVLALCVLVTVLGSSFALGEAAAESCGGKVDWGCSQCTTYVRDVGCTDTRDCLVYVLGGCHGAY
jgi:hypothetical protein